MKRSLFIAIIFILFSIASYAQSDTSRFKAKEQYCMVLATSKLFSTKVNITVDFGQETKLFNFKDSRLKDQEGKLLTFNSTIDALNYMASQGWEFVNAYAVTSNSQNVYHYVLRRKIN